MVLLALPPADHLLIERDRGQFVPSRRRRMMASVRAERLLKIPADPSPELRIPGAAAQTRVVSVAGIRLGSWESARAFKGIICDDISEFESHMPNHAVRSLPANVPARVERQAGMLDGASRFMTKCVCLWLRRLALLGVMTLGGVIHVLGTVRAHRPQWPSVEPANSPTR